MEHAEFAISVENVTKTFRIHVERNSTLKERILYKHRSSVVDFVALKDVTLRVKKGTTVGLLGVNGSGKSTLLKLMSKILYPDRGEVTVNGRVSSLLELGAGFHPDFSGRENIFMNGAILGLTKKELNEKLDDIITFSELGDFIDQPVRSYSSGMYMRLAFSVAVAVDPEILLIDEILAVGDAAFQAKCMSRIKQLQADGKTIVIVTHDTAAVERFCDTAVWMHNSKVQMQGEVVPCVQAYLDAVFRTSHDGLSRMTFDRAQGNTEEFAVASKQNEVKRSQGDDVSQGERFGSGVVKIRNVTLSSAGGNSLLNCGDSCEIELSYESAETLENVVFGFGIFSESGIHCYGTNTLIDRLGALSVTPGRHRLKIAIPSMNLLPGEYYLDIAIHAESGEPFDYWQRAKKISIKSHQQNEQGVVRIDHAWKL